MLIRFFAAAGVGIAMAGCASQTIVPSYATSNPNIQIGGSRPADGEAQVEQAGSFCLATTEQWHQDGKTPDGKALWARDTYRKVVPCE